MHTKIQAGDLHLEYSRIWHPKRTGFPRLDQVLYGGFLRWGDPQIIRSLDHFSVENHGFADPTISETPICICLSGFFMPVPRGSTIAATTVPSCYSPGEEVKLRCSNHLEVNRVEAPPFYPNWVMLAAGLSMVFAICFAG